jgi:hypothetical protein
MGIGLFGYFGIFPTHLPRVGHTKCQTLAIVKTNIKISLSRKRSPGGRFEIGKVPKHAICETLYINYLFRQTQIQHPHRLLNNFLKSFVSALRLILFANLFRFSRVNEVSADRIVLQHIFSARNFDAEQIFH